MEINRFKGVLKERGITGKDFALMIGLSYGSYRSSVSRGDCPKWALAFLLGCDSSIVEKLGWKDKLKERKGES